MSETLEFTSFPLPLYKQPSKISPPPLATKPTASKSVTLFFTFFHKVNQRIMNCRSFTRYASLRYVSLVIGPGTGPQTLLMLLMLMLMLMLLLLLLL